MITLRSSTPDDAEGVARCVDVVARERRFLASTTGFGTERTRAFLRSLADGGGVQIVALDGTAVVGWCDVLPGPFEGMRHVGQLGMGVLPGHRGRGLGRRLLRETLAAAFATGLRRVDLEVFASNWAALRLYDREGFTVTGRRSRVRLVDGIEDDAILMSLDAPPAGAPAARGPRAPAPIGSPVLDSVLPVIAASRHVRTDVSKIVEHARWLACEPLPMPEFGPPFGLGDRVDDLIDFVLVSTCINTAFTDFTTGAVFEADYGGRRWSDAEAMMACLRRAMDDGVPVLDGAFLARATRQDLDHVFRGTIEMPMLDEKRAVLNEVGQVLDARYGGRFRAFVASCPPRLFDGGRGLLDRLVREFPRFDDVSRYRGHEVRFYKLAQLGFWVLFCTLRSRGGFRLDDLPSMTAFADYIVPLALRAMDILQYTPRLDAAIEAHHPVERDSDEEIEIRAHTIYATALLTEEINRHRPPHLRVIVPQLDARLWHVFHTTHRPHHLTRTIMY